VILFEDPLFFGDPHYPARMHRQKLWLHRASMARYRQELESRGFEAGIFPYERNTGACLHLFERLSRERIDRIVMAEPVDHIAEKRLKEAAQVTGITLEFRPSPGFLNTRATNQAWSGGRKRWFMAEYYKSQRRRLNILMEGGQPAGGQWSFDEENRKKVPKALLKNLPWIDWPQHDAVDHAARDSVLREFPEARGHLDTLYYPTSHAAALAWLHQFL
jgi:deoxyribodipyrimidine photolyase-related protein